MILALALSYGGREDIVQAARQLAREVAHGRIDAEEITEVTFEARLSTSELPPLDLMIRTSGELRISNFLLWQAAYAELFFTPVMWPDFRRAQLVEAINAYAMRQRRFGMTSEQLSGGLAIHRVPVNESSK
jgi:undecaprenyl diphosphate synthase